MSNPNVYNAPNPNYEVKTRELSDNSVVQHVQLDIGTGTSSSLVDASNPLPTTTTSYTLRVDDGATYMYIGQALAGASEADPVWRIKRLTQVDLTILYPLGSSGFNQKWSDRLTLSYL